MVKPTLDLDLYRTVILTILAGIAVLVISFANRDVYAKEEIDFRFNKMQEQHDTSCNYTNKRLEDLHVDVRWIIQQMGGKDNADTQ